MITSEVQKKKKTELVTFRFEKEMLKNLRNEAKTKEISLNTLMGQIINQYLDYYSKVSGLGIIPMLDTQLKLILKDFSKSELQTMVHDWSKKYLEGTKATCNSENALESLQYSLENMGKTSGINVVKMETDKSIAITLRHNCGKNFSIFFREMMLSGVEGYIK